MKTGNDVRIHEDAVFSSPNVELGNHVAVDKGVYCTTKAKIGDYVHLAPYVVVIGGKDAELVMQEFSGLASGSKIICGGDDFASGYLMNPQVPVKFRKPIIGKVTLERFACVGVNSVVMPNVTMKEGSVLGANSVLTKDAEPWTVYAGCPAKPIKKRPKDHAYKFARDLGYELE
jgi:acetyltransferase-like isoleucine patch superfamily enzyme